jgi:tetratricopeptide (TPR) repeat protein
MFDHYLHSAYAADRLLKLHRDPIHLDPPAPGVTVDGPADETRARDWFTVEHPVLLGALRSAVETGFQTHACRLAWTLSDFLIRRVHWRVLADSQRAALAAAGALGDRFEQARAERGLGAAYTRLGRYDDARVCFQNSLERFESLGDAAGQAHTHLSLAEVLDRLGRHAEALTHAERALGPADASGHPPLFARALNAVGWYHAQLGQYRQAITHCGRSLQLQQAIGDRDGAADSWDSLGLARHHLNEHELALDCYQRALRLWQETGNRQGQADTLVNIGDTRAALDRADAVEAWRQALWILEDLGHPDAERVRDKLQLTPASCPGGDSRLAASDTG